MTVLSINMAKQIQFVGKNFMRNFKPVVEVLDFCESKKVCLLSSGIDSSPKRMFLTDENFENQLFANLNRHMLQVRSNKLKL